MQGTADIAEQEEQTDQHKDAVERQSECVGTAIADQLHEVLVIDVPEQVIEVEHVESEADTGWDRQQCHDGNHHILDQIVKPSGAKHQGLLARSRNEINARTVVVEAFGHPFLAILDDKIQDGVNDLDVSQLEVPPHQNKQRGEDIACDGHTRCSAKSQQREPTKETVEAVHFLGVLQAGIELPEEENDKNGREDEIHQRVGHKDHTEADDCQSHAKGGHIHLESMLQQIGIQPEHQSKEDGRQQPKVGIGKTCCNM